MTQRRNTQQNKGKDPSEAIFHRVQGRPLPLGVTKETGLINFSVIAENTDSCMLHLFDKNTRELVKTFEMKAEDKVGDIFCLGLKPFDLDPYVYAYQAGIKSWIDPYADRILGRETWGEPVFRENQIDLRGGFLDEEYDWEDDRPLKTPFEDTILYRMHVRGFTKDTSSKVEGKGTFRGVMEKIGYLKELGITAIELLPAYEFDEIMYEQKPMRNESLKDIPHKINYWGYSAQNQYFAPKCSFASVPERAAFEFKDMVKTLHRAGIEVIMEFYFVPGMREQIILDCLRFWVMEYHVDGFKINQNAVSSKLVATDAFLGATKIFGLGWNTEEIYAGEYKPKQKNLAEYNEGFLTDIRRFLKGDEEQVGKASHRMVRNPARTAVINYLSNTNGFTLMDVFTYDLKHNEENGEKGRDGTDYNFSWNCGTEGPTKRKKVLEVRKKQMKNAYALLFLSQGVPLILAGDEFGNSQGGNNNAYCQDNKTSWLDWRQVNTNAEYLEFVKQMIKLRKSHPILHGKEELKGRDYASCGFPDLSFHGTKAWYPDYSNYSRVFGIMLCGKYAMVDRAHHDTTFYIACNMHWEDQEFDLPTLDKGVRWQVMVNTAQIPSIVEGKPLETLTNQKKFVVKAHSVVVFIGK